jgi:hypothetical protein
LLAPGIVSAFFACLLWERRLFCGERIAGRALPAAAPFRRALVFLVD